MPPTDPTPAEEIPGWAHEFAVSCTDGARRQHQAYTRRRRHGGSRWSRRHG